MRVAILLADFVEALEIDTESKGAVLLFDEEDWSSMGRGGRLYETCSKVFVDESLESGKLDWRQRVECSQGWRCSFLKIDLQVIVAMGQKLRGSCLTEDICIVAILRRDASQFRRR